MQKPQKDKLFNQMLLFINICLMTKLIEEKLEIKKILLNKNLIENKRKNEDLIKFKKLKINWTKLKKIKFIKNYDYVDDEKEIFENILKELIKFHNNLIIFEEEIISIENFG